MSRRQLSALIVGDYFCTKKQRYVKLLLSPR